MPEWKKEKKIDKKFYEKLIFVESYIWMEFSEFNGTSTKFLNSPACAEAVVRRCFVKKVFWKIFRNLVTDSVCNFIKNETLQNF